MEVRVTIGLCVKDSESTIRQCIESIISQKYPMELIQLVVVDGCSKDKTLSIISSATSKTCMRVETYSDKGEGLGTARQIVVNNAKGKYVIFVDADIRLFSDLLRNHVKIMEKNPGIGVAFGKPVLQKGTLIATVLNLAAYAAGGSIGTGASICRSEVLRQVGGFDTKIKGAAEDRDLFVRFRLQGWQVSVNETARFFHKPRENLCSFWVEQSWFGYGDHYFNHKYSSINTVWRKFPAGDSGNFSLTFALFVGSVGTVWRKLPSGEFVWGLKLASRAYQRTRRKLSFLILPQMILGNIGWWAGFAKGHKDGYGHGKSVCSDSKSAEKPFSMINGKCAQHV
jgi:glycosyltransferase involved in cell wall biosynthesis